LPLNSPPCCAEPTVVVCDGGMRAITGLPEMQHPSPANA
jgi:hypothetical protein